MFGIVEAVTGGLGMLSNIAGGGNQGNGMGGGLGGLISKFLDPLGLLGGDGQDKLSDRDKELIEEVVKEVMAQYCEEGESSCDCEECTSVSDTSADNWQNILISTGSGDDTVTIG
jgi:hypothetical protein